jgi:hypothetical protein
LYHGYFSAALFITGVFCSIAIEAISVPERFLLQSHDLTYHRDIFFAGLGNLAGQIPKVENFFEAPVQTAWKQFDFPSGTTLATYF